PKPQQAAGVNPNLLTLDQILAKRGKTTKKRTATGASTGVWSPNTVSASRALDPLRSDAY
ncbi:MAG: hypothetical protein KKD02_23335, partial [Alphaproteobacteria bacterium]|nr:hypothetical protein [Alphaproteobacteria bacterium]